ncbi:MAG: TIM barrel protein [Candidatus Omnitrophica bacterium]|nr:TIM barrel protein [Candidatus Omnitrophota bacterium]MCA9426185.1 TIM barrel protein [Candidatus Omnitrophota bacterium]MCA9429571.1 TIM barrel protein [Candidatus Omnitrophota bacterium]MCA9437263.1 TIM barrel protein [Candidatus Omnitrophota bacterium]MCA9450118.1 TIM barrel protein [Candidatus Omnitrophota bacterium]
MAVKKKKAEYRFSFGPWNIHEGADPFGPPVRESFTWDEKIRTYRKLGFTGIQFHDDDVADASLPFKAAMDRAKEVKKILNGEGLEPEFTAPRLWEDDRGIDGAFTANDPKVRRWAVDRTKRCIDIGNAIGTHKMVIWPAREGTYIREAKDAAAAYDLFVDYLNKALAYDSKLKILIEPKPNEPMDLAYCPTIGHAIGLAYRTKDPKRVGALIESAHAILANLDPSDEMAYAISHKKLWSVHLNDQNSLKYDQDKVFGSANLRRAFNQVMVLEEAAYGSNGEWVGLDIKVMRTQKRENSFLHLKNSRELFMKLVKVYRGINKKEVEALREARDYETLDRMILDALLGS